jgi:hypothetical protein
VALIPGDGATGVREEVVTIQATHALEGILSEPVSTSMAPRHAVVMLNAGAIRHIGPNRLHVAWARAWTAHHGLTTLRLDLGGIGDGGGPQARTVEELYHPRCLADLHVALHKMQDERGIKTFTLIGLCSGAYLAFRMGLEHTAIKRVVLLNPQSFVTAPEEDSLDGNRSKSVSTAVHYKRSFLKPHRWAKLLGGDVDVGRALRILATRVSIMSRDKTMNVLSRLGWVTSTPTLADFERALQRGLDIQLIYCEGDPGIEHLLSYLGPNLRNLSRPGAVNMEIVDGPNHTFTPLWSQVWLSDNLARRAGAGVL